LLPGGLTVPLEPLRLALSLETRGFNLAREDKVTLRVQPAERLTDADCRVIRHWKWHLLALLDCRVPASVH